MKTVLSIQHLCLALGLAALVPCALALEIPGNPPAKAILDQQISIGPRSLALPEGQWTYIAQAQWSTSLGPPPRSPVYAAYAMDVQNGRMRGGIVLELPSRTTLAADWKAERCTARNPQYSDDFGSTMDMPECLQIFKRTGHLLGVQADFYAQAQQWVQASSVRLPGPVYEVVYTKYSRNDYGRIRVFVPAQSMDNDEAMLAWAKQLPDALRNLMEKRDTSAKLPALPPLSAETVVDTAAVLPVLPGSTPVIVPYTASGFAKVDDINALPFKTETVRKIYRQWLNLPLPRAFAFSSEKVIATAGLDPADPTEPTDPSDRALARCRRISTSPCQLYAVDNLVVWVKPADASAP
ncbi:hypothetical protein os1_35100 [Comamonadaceae bacterium OS-1]|nr:hypothetical protein os1_35100 [Comamonadaceae bacterium OS-1]